MPKEKKIAITLVRSLIGRKPKHILCAKGLGLKKMHQTVEREDTPSIRGMVRKIDYLLKVEEI